VEKGHGGGKASAAMTPSVNDDAALGTRESMDRDVVHLRRRWSAAERSRQLNERVPLKEWKHFLPLHHLLGCIKRRILFPFDPRSDCGSSLSLSLDPFLQKNGNNGMAKKRIFSARESILRQSKAIIHVTACEDFTLLRPDH
jgi:hypothetical protein